MMNPNTGRSSIFAVVGNGYNIQFFLFFLFHYVFPQKIIYSCSKNPKDITFFLYFCLDNIDYQLDKTFNLGFGSHIVFQIERFEVSDILKLFRLEFAESNGCHVLG